MTVQDQIYEWVQGFDPWKQELFICAASAPELLEADAVAVASMLLGEEVDGRGPREISRGDLPAAENADKPMAIKKVCELENVNVIADGQSLDFEPEGINVVWGANGAGKTGYSRILKHAGRTLHREGVLSNVAAQAQGLRPKARVVVTIDGKERGESLDLVGAAPGYLGRICIADAKAGEIYLTKQNEVDYVPATLASLSRLADGLNAVKAILQARSDAVRVPEVDPKAFGEATSAGRLVAGLSAETPEDVVRRLSELSEDELKLRDELRKKVGELDAMQAPQLRQAAQRDAAAAARLLVDLEATTAALDETSIKAARERSRALREAREAAQLAAQHFERQPLAGVGSEPWRLLWSAARQFANHLGQELPAEHDPAHCPLCMQELSAEARDRLLEFDQFISDDVNARLAELEVQRQQALDRLPDVEALRRQHQSTLELLGEAEGEPGAEILAWLDRAAGTLAQLREERLEGLAPLTVPPQLDPWIASRRAEAERHAATERGEENAQMRRDLSDLQGRALLAERLADVLVRIAALREVERLRKAIAETSTTAVSRKIGTFSQELIQAGLEQALNRQLRSLEFRGLEVVPRTRTVSGRSMVYLAFKTVDGVALTDVLSHGEQRRLALAMFLAEMEVLSDPSPVVFDDPTSSVDQEGRRQIARTLGRLAQKRQVIVFTHELAFVQELSRIPGAVPLNTQHVKRIGDTVGHVRPELPWEGLSPKERVGPLRDRYNALEKAYEKRDDEVYGPLVLPFCSLLRNSFERAVEDRVLAGVIVRKTADVHTKMLRDINCNEEICDLVDRGMDDNSPWVHDQALADGATPPNPDELKEGLDVYVELLDKVGALERGREAASEKSKAKRKSELKAVEAGRAGVEQARPDLKPVPDLDEVPDPHIQPGLPPSNGSKSSESD